MPLTRQKPLWDLWAVDGEESARPEHTQQGEGGVSFCSAGYFCCQHGKLGVTCGQMLWINPQLERLKALIHSPFSLLVSPLHF